MLFDGQLPNTFIPNRNKERNSEFYNGSGQIVGLAVCSI